MTKEQLHSIELPPLKTTFAIRGNIQDLKKQVNSIIENKERNLLQIERKTIEIDWVLLNLAQRTLNNMDRNKMEISRLKENTWNLLEKLESYCLTNLNTSIW